MRLVHFFARELPVVFPEVSSFQPGLSWVTSLAARGQNSSGAASYVILLGLSAVPLADPARFELTTSAFGGQRSIMRPA